MEDHPDVAFPVEAVAQFFTALSTAIMMIDRVPLEQRTSKNFLDALDYWARNPNPASLRPLVQNATEIRTLLQMLQIGVDEARDLNPPA